jgi:required for meiotic nuclear division protein 1
MLQKVVSYHIAESIDVKEFSASFDAELCYNDPAELFYKTGPDQFVYIFKYGAVCFLNYNADAISKFLDYIKQFCRKMFQQQFTDEFLVETGAKEMRVGFNKIEVPAQTKTDVLRLVMLNVSQSVALDYYEDQTHQLMTETNRHTQMLEHRGKLSISGKKLRQYIARTLLVRNRIAENIYVFDSPPETWEDESLNKLDADLKRTFDLQVRVRTVHESLSMVRDNLELFRALLQHRYSNILEWIVIILILVEVINLAVEKLFH